MTVAFTKEALKKAMGPLAETPGRSSVARVGMTGAGWEKVAQRQSGEGPRGRAQGLTEGGLGLVIRGHQETHQISPSQRALSVPSDPL